MTLFRLVEDYPFAIVYPIHTFVASNPNSVEGNRVKRLIDGKIPAAKSLINGLEMLVDPLVVLQTWVFEVRRLVKAKIEPPLRDAWREMKTKVNLEHSEPGNHLRKMREMIRGWLRQVRNL